MWFHLLYWIALISTWSLGNYSKQFERTYSHTFLLSKVDVSQQVACPPKQRRTVASVVLSIALSHVMMEMFSKYIFPVVIQTNICKCRIFSSVLSCLHWSSKQWQLFIWKSTLLHFLSSIKSYYCYMAKYVCCRAWWYWNCWAGRGGMDWSSHFHVVYFNKK